MKLEKQVTSLGLSKKLKKLGVKQKSIWMWVKYELWKEPQIWRSDLATDVKLTCLSGKREYAYSAFTCAELGIRAKGIFYGIRESGVCWGRIDMSFYSNRKWSPEDSAKEIFEATTEANCRAKMLIYLIENKLINIAK